MEYMDIEQSVKILKSLADETRLSIVRRLAEIDKEVNSRDLILDCATTLRLAQPTMSHHFSRLVAAGVLLESKVGVEKSYRLNKQLLVDSGINPDKL